MKWTSITTATLSMLMVALVADAQPTDKVYRIGWLSRGEAGTAMPQKILEGLRTLGYAEGRNLVVEYRYAKTWDELPKLAAELATERLDLILTNGTPATRAAKQATATIPIVFTLSADPVASGLISSFARPGANVTGVAGGLYEDKMLEILQQAIPGLARVACMCANRPDVTTVKINSAAKVLGLDIIAIEVGSPAEFERFFSAARDAGAQAVLVHDVSSFTPYRERLGKLSAEAGLPAIGVFHEFAEAGGLLAYETLLRTGSVAREAVFVDKILRGAKPADLPIEQPMEFKLIVNLKTAKAIGVKIPAALLLQADEILR